jgi:RNA polymerase sigma-70 factor (ECF subfamily)
MTVSDYNKCVDLHSSAIFRFALKQLRNPDDAKEIVQITFEKLWMKRDTVQIDTAKSYLFTTAYHSMVDAWRVQKPTEDVETLSPAQHPTTEALAYDGLMETLEKALSQISQIQKTVILLRDYEGYSYAEIGEITGLNEAQVKVNIFRGRQALKEIIGNPNNLI